MIDFVAGAIVEQISSSTFKFCLLKIYEICPLKRLIFASKCTKMRLVASSARTRCMGAYSAPPGPLAGLKGEGKERGKSEGEEMKKPEGLSMSEVRWRPWLQVPEPTAEASKSSSSSSSASTRVSEFRSKFEKFGAKSKRSESVEEQQQQRHKSELDAHEVSRQLQRQLEDVQRTRDDERKQLLQRLEDQRTTLGNEIKELRDRNAAVSRSINSINLFFTPRALRS